MTLHEPFSFTKGVQPLQIATRTMSNAHSFGTMLFDVENDPQQENPLIDDEVEHRMIDLMVKWMRWNEAPQEQFERLGLPVDGKSTEAHLLLARQHELVVQARAKREALPLYTGRGAEFLARPVRDLLTILTGQELVSRYFPHVLDAATVKMMGTASLLQIASFAPSSFTSESLAAFAADLADYVESGLTEVPAVLDADEASQ
jgi:hypothetical protein